MTPGQRDPEAARRTGARRTIWVFIGITVVMIVLILALTVLVHPAGPAPTHAQVRAAPDRASQP